MPQGPAPSAAYKDPLQAIGRLSTIPLPPRSSDAAFEEAFMSLPILSANGKEAAKASERDRRARNKAVHTLLHGIHKRDWRLAFHEGWSPLFLKDGLHAKLNMDTVESLVRLWITQDEGTITADWKLVSERLLVPTILREIELQNEHKSVVAEWMLSELSKTSDAARKRAIEFWTLFVNHAKEQSLGEKRGDPFYLLQIPSNLFTSALVAYFQSSLSLKAFIASFYETIAVPTSYKPSFALEYVHRALYNRRSDSNTPAAAMEEDLEELGYWLRQMPLIRIWARVGDQSIRMACSIWRERRHHTAAKATWKSVEEALSRLSDVSDEAWLVIDWSKPQEHATLVQTDAAKELLTEQAGDDKTGGQRLPVGREMWKHRPQLPIRFTPNLAAEFVRTFMHLDLLNEAEAAWNFVKSLKVEPNIIMWTALLHGHLHRHDLNAAEAVIEAMEKTSDAKPDMTARSILAMAYFQSNEIEAGREAVSKILTVAKNDRPGHELTTRICNSLITGLLWNNNSPELALQIVKQMQENERTPVDVYTVNILLRHYSRRSTFNLSGVTKTLELLSQSGLEPDTYTLSMLLDALLLAGRPDAVSKVQQIMESLNVKANTATYGGMINHLVKHAIKTGEENRLSTALELLRHMQASGDSTSRPTEITYSALIQAFCRFAVIWDSSAHLETGEALHDEMVELGIPPNRITYNSLMAAHLAKDNVSKALYYFSEYRKLKHRRGGQADLEELKTMDIDASTTLRHNVSVRTWQALITGLVDKKRYAVAREVLQEMRELGVEIRSPAFQKVAQIAVQAGKEVPVDRS